MNAPAYAVAAREASVRGGQLRELPQTEHSSRDPPTRAYVIRDSSPRQYIVRETASRDHLVRELPQGELPPRNPIPVYRSDDARYI